MTKLFQHRGASMSFVKCNLIKRTTNKLRKLDTKKKLSILYELLDNWIKKVGPKNKRKKK